MNIPSSARSADRKEFVTRGPDPTVVVEWLVVSKTGRTVKTTEFQCIYFVEVDGLVRNDSETVALATELHNALEDAWQEERIEQDARTYHRDFYGVSQ